MAEGVWELLAWGFALAEAPLPDATSGSELLVASTLGGGVRRIALADGSEDGELFPDRRGIGGLVHATGGGLVATGPRCRRAGSWWDPAQPGSAQGHRSDRVQRPGGDPRGRPAGRGAAVPTLCRRASHTRRSRPAARGLASTWDRGTLTWPNGLAFSPDGRVLYAADLATGIVHRALWQDGQPAALTPWVSSPSGQADGLAVDAAGQVLGRRSVRAVRRSGGPGCNPTVAAACSSPTSTSPASLHCRLRYDASAGPRAQHRALARPAPPRSLPPLCWYAVGQAAERSSSRTWVPRRHRRAGQDVGHGRLLAQQGRPYART